MNQILSNWCMYFDMWLYLLFYLFDSFTIHLLKLLNQLETVVDLWSIFNRMLGKTISLLVFHTSKATYFYFICTFFNPLIWQYFNFLQRKQRPGWKWTKFLPGWKSHSLKGKGRREGRRHMFLLVVTFALWHVKCFLMNFDLWIQPCNSTVSCDHLISTPTTIKEAVWLDLSEEIKIS